MITYSIAALHRESNRLKDIERQRSKTRWSSFEYVTVYEGSVFSVLFFQKNSNVGFTPYNSIVIFTRNSMVHNEQETYSFSNFGWIASVKFYFFKKKLILLL